MLPKVGSIGVLLLIKKPRCFGQVGLVDDVVSFEDRARFVTADPYRLPTFKTLAQDLCTYLDEGNRKILLGAIYECMGVDLS